MVAMKQKSLLLQNSADYEGFLDLLRRTGWEREPEAYLQCAEQVAMFCYHNHVGRFADGALENELLEIGRQLDRILEGPHFSFATGQMPRLRKHSRRHVLHVTSGVFRVGGPTRTIVNWIRNDPDTCHSLLLTRQENPREIRNWVSETVTGNGGQILVLPTKLPLLLRAKLMREISRCADILVIHDSVEAIRIVAYALTEGPPVALVNHSDHLFWAGSSIADSVVNLRSVGLRLSEQRRFARHNSLLPIPMTDRPMALSRAEARLKLGIPNDQIMLLSIARETKYIPDERQNFIRTATKILEHNPEAHLHVVGMSRAFAEAKLTHEPHPRLHFLGYVEDPSVHQRAADIYLESFPFGSQTAFLETAMVGVAPVHAFAPAFDLLATNDDAIADIAVTPRNEEEYIDLANRLTRNIEERHQVGSLYRQRLLDAHTGEGWRHSLAVIYAQLDGITHTPHVIPVESCSTTELDLALCTWQRSQKQISGEDINRSVVLGQLLNTTTKMPNIRDQRTRNAMLCFIRQLRNHDHVTSRLAPLSLFAFFFRYLDSEENSLSPSNKEEIRRELLLALAKRTELARWRRDWAEYWEYRNYLKEKGTGQADVPAIVNERVLPWFVYWAKDHLESLWQRWVLLYHP
jgi:hypothetical protein